MTKPDDSGLLNPLLEPLQQLGLQPGTQFEAFPLAFQLFLALLAGLLAWLLIHNGQTRATEENRRIERAKVLHELDRDYADLMSRRCVVRVRAKVPDTVKPQDLLLFETVLTASVVWHPSVQREGVDDTPYHYINGARHIEVAPGYLVDTLTLHRVIAWSKRVASAVDACIVARRDLTDMWRNVLPWARHNRFSFMADYFGASEARAPSAERLQNLQRWRNGWVRLARAPVTLLGGVGLWWQGLLNRFRAVRRGVPVLWSGDIAPLYALIRSVLADALARDRVEILNYVGMDKGPQSEDLGKLDPLARRVLLGR